MSKENKLETMLVTLLKDKENLQTEEILRLARQLAPVVQLWDDSLIENVVKNVEARLVTTMREGFSLIDPNSDHDEDWYLKKSDQSWDYWKDYECQLVEKRWSPHVVTKLGDVSGKLLGLLADPQLEQGWDRRGLVIGQVQSGKTASYVGLITKAADAGYRFIIVIAGTQNNLRKQTQQRIEEGFVGRDSSPGAQSGEIGVGVLNKNRKFPITLTTTDGDFSKKIANQLGADLHGFSKPVIVVIKKNVTTLKTLYTWLKDFNTKGVAGKITDIPMLMIDDESDNASVNTNKPDLDPTRTNEGIRKILHLFNKKCYVGYTATPFANIFINPESTSEMLGDELFPKDFIYCLDSPSNYFSARKVFVDDETSKNFVRVIDDAEALLPLSHKIDSRLSMLPNSLLDALYVFVLGKAIRILRNQGNKHTTMMINVSRFNDIQSQVKDLIAHHLKNLSNAVRYNHAKPQADAMKDRYIATLKDCYDTEFSFLSETWDDVLRVLSDAADSIRVYLINLKSEDTLDYKKADDNDEGITGIAIGGLSLSRGLTLEGLTVSYMYRNTKMYDTLMQMGRWFGYREGYEDLCRIWLSEESRGWYSHISEAIEDLRVQIFHMRREGLRPIDFGLYVRSHPDALIVTALNKMRSAEERHVSVSLSNKLQETHVLPMKLEITSHNLEVSNNLFETLNTVYIKNYREIKGSHYWAEIPSEFAENFVAEFFCHSRLALEKQFVIDYLRAVSSQYPFVDVVFVSLQGDKSGQYGLPGGQFVYIQERSVGAEPPQGEAGYRVGDKQRVAGTGLEKIGLSEELLRKAEENAEEHGSKVSDRDYRAVRPRPLLMIHMLKLVKINKVKNVKESLVDLVPAYGISFPGSGFKTVDVVVNKVWLKQYLESQENPSIIDEDDE